MCSAEERSFRKDCRQHQRERSATIDPLKLESTEYVQLLPDGESSNATPVRKSPFDSLVAPYRLPAASIIKPAWGCPPSLPP